MAHNELAEGDGEVQKGHRLQIISLVFAVVIIFFSFPLVSFTWSIIRIYILHVGASRSSFEVHSWCDATVFSCALAAPLVLALGGVGILAALKTAWPKWPLLGLLLAFTIELFMMVVVPDLPIWHAELAANRIYMESLEHHLEPWAREHDRFPATAAEVGSAIRGIPTAQSVYRSQGAALWYEVQAVPGQPGPYQTWPNRPGIVYYAVDSSGRQFWMTVSGLNTPYADIAVMGRTDPLTGSKQPWGNLLVVSETLVSLPSKHL